MIRSRIFIPTKFNALIERANAICKERQLYQIAKTDVIRTIYRNPDAFKCDTREAARAAVMSNLTAPRYVGLDVVAMSNEGVTITAIIPRDLMAFAREVNKVVGGKRSVRAWQVALKLFAQIHEINSDDDIVNAFVAVAERETRLAAKIM